MRSVIIAAFLGIATLTPAAAQTAPPTVFQGTLFITKDSGAACRDAGVDAGQSFVFVYRPHLVAGNPPSLFAYFGQRAAGQIVADGDEFSTSGNYLGRLIGSRAGFIEYNGTYSNFSVKPSSISDTTKTVQVSGKLQGFHNTDCEITFTAGGLRRPD